MNIAFFFESDINPIKGGTERVTWSVAKYLISKGMKVVFIAHQKRNDFDPSLLSYHRFLPDPVGYDTLENIRYLQNLIQNEKINILVNQGGLSDEVKLCNKKILQDQVKIVSVIHYGILEDLYYFKEFLRFQFIWNKPFIFIKSLLRYLRMPLLKKKAVRNRKHQLSFLYRYSDVIVLLSEGFKDDFFKFIENAKKEKLFVIPNPNTYEKIYEQSLKNKDNIVLYVGRLSYSQKRVDRLITIWKNIEGQFPEWKFLIIGDGPERKLLEDLALKYKLKHIYFLGYQDPEIYYQKARILCLSSTYEGFGMALTEAMQHKVVPIAFGSYKALYDIVEDKKNGFVIPPFDLSVYASRLSLLMKDSRLCARLAENAQEKVLEFDIEKVGEKWIDLFKFLCQNEKC